MIKSKRRKIIEYNLTIIFPAEFDAALGIYEDLGYAALDSRWKCKNAQYAQCTCVRYYFPSASVDRVSQRVTFRMLLKPKDPNRN